jgi:TolB-like protein
VTDALPGAPGQPSTLPTGERLDSWKEIAAHLKRDVSTVKRWEKREGLPIHRHLHDKRGSIYAYAAQLDAWREGRGARLDGGGAADASEAETAERDTSDAEPSKAETSRAETSETHTSQTATIGTTARPPAAARVRWFVSLLMAGVVVTGLAYRWMSGASMRASTPVPVRSLAVLPFKPLVAAARDEYLELGLADALITRLSIVRQLVVRPTSSIVKYAAAGSDPLRAGRELGVDAVLDASVQRAGDRVRITVRLLRVADGTALWANTFDQRQSTDVFNVETVVSERLTETLMLTLSAEEKNRLNRRDTPSPEAYQLFLRGRYCWSKRTEEWLTKAVGFFQRAIESDPAYALAYVGLADAYTHLALVNVGGLPPREAFPKAKDAALKALAIDRGLAEAHAALGFVALHYDWDPAAAERELQQAIDLKPQYAPAHMWYGENLSTLGRHDEAIGEATRADEIEPASLDISRGVGARLYQARRYDKAIEQLRKTLELDPTHDQTRYILGLTYVAAARFDEGIRELTQSVGLSGGSPTTLGALGYAYARAGRNDDARNTIEELTALSKRRYVSPYNIALIYAGLRDDDQAFGWLERAYAERSSRLTYLRVLPEFDGLRSDRRFGALLRRIGLPG